MACKVQGTAPSAIRREETLSWREADGMWSVRPFCVLSQLSQSTRKGARLSLGAGEHHVSNGGSGYSLRRSSSRVGMGRGRLGAGAGRCMCKSPVSYELMREVPRFR